MPASEQTGKRDIVLFKKGGGCKFINSLHCNYDTFAYVLFHVFGDEGWKMDIPFSSIVKSSTSKHVTVRQFYSHRLMYRSANNICLHHPVNILFFTFVHHTSLLSFNKFAVVY